MAWRTSSALIGCGAHNRIASEAFAGPEKNTLEADRLVPLFQMVEGVTVCLVLFRRQLHAMRQLGGLIAGLLATVLVLLTALSARRLRRLLLLQKSPGARSGSSACAADSVFSVQSPSPLKPKGGFLGPPGDGVDFCKTPR